MIEENTEKTEHTETTESVEGSIVKTEIDTPQETIESQEEKKEETKQVEAPEEVIGTTGTIEGNSANVVTTDVSHIEAIEPPAKRKQGRPRKNPEEPVVEEPSSNESDTRNDNDKAFETIEWPHLIEIKEENIDIRQLPQELRGEINMWTAQSKRKNKSDNMMASMKKKSVVIADAIRDFIEKDLPEKTEEPIQPVQPIQPVIEGVDRKIKNPIQVKILKQQIKKLRRIILCRTMGSRIQSADPLLVYLIFQSHLLGFQPKRR